MPETTSQPAVETLEQIANRICRHYLDSERVSVTQFCDIEAAILSALRNERERAARIAEAHNGHGSWCASAIGDCQSLTVKAIAVAIREGQCNE